MTKEFSKTCFGRHMGIWAVEPQWFETHFAMFQAGTLAQSEYDEEEERKPYPMNEHGIAVISVSGQMTKGWSKFGGASMTQLRHMLHCAGEDASVRGVMLVIDSPGGTVAGMGELAQEARMLREKKPVYAHIDDLGASAAYWLASQADKITANETAEVGSIGVFTAVYDASKKFQKDGIKVNLVASGKLKGQGTPGLPVKQEFLDQMQSKIDRINEIFIRDVADGRGKSVDTVQEWATGMTFLAQDAKEMGMVDGVMWLSDALIAMQEGLDAGLMRMGVAAQAPESSLVGATFAYAGEQYQVVPLGYDVARHALSQRDSKALESLAVECRDALSHAEYEPIEARIPTEADLSSMKPYAKPDSERYEVKELLLTHSEINRQGTRFELDDLETLAMLIGRDSIPLTRDHNLTDSEKKCGRVTTAFVRRNAQKNRVELIGTAYIPKREPYLNLLADIEDGVQREGSLSYTFKTPLCSICRHDLRLFKECDHVPGRTYRKDGKDEQCHVLKKEPRDVFEFSFVTVPFTQEAGILSQHDGSGSVESSLSGSEWLTQLINQKEAFKAMEQPATTKTEVIVTPEAGAETPQVTVNGNGEGPQSPELSTIIGALEKVTTALESQSKVLAVTQERLEKVEKLNDSQKSKVAYEEGEGASIIRSSNQAYRNFLKHYQDDTDRMQPLRIKRGREYITLPRNVNMADLASLGDWRRNKVQIFAGMMNAYPDIFQGDALTLKADVADEFLTVLSTLMRDPSTFNNVWHQFTVGAVELGRRPGDTVRVPRYAFLADPTDEASRTLTPGTDITGSQALSEKAVSVVIKERGLATPIGIAEFTQVRSLTDLVAIANRNLNRDYNLWVDNVIRDLYLTATTVLYPDDNVAATTLDANDVFNKDFLVDIETELFVRKIPTFPNGRWVGVLNPYDVKNLRKSFIGLANNALAQDQDNISRYLFPEGQGVVSGYVGSAGRLDLFASNNTGVGASSSSPVPAGVQAAGSSPAIDLGSSSFFGPGAVGRGIGMPVEVRHADETNFGRRDLLIWLSHEGFGELDINEAAGTLTETRVIETRCAR